MRYNLPDKATNIEKLLQGLIEEETIQFLSIDKTEQSIQIFAGGWNVTLKADGTWRIE